MPGRLWACSKLLMGWVLADLHTLEEEVPSKWAAWVGVPGALRAAHKLVGLALSKLAGPAQAGSSWVGPARAGSNKVWPLNLVRIPFFKYMINSPSGANQ